MQHEAQRIERRRLRVLKAHHKNYHYLEVVYKVQAEFARQAIHEGKTPREVTDFICNNPGGYITTPTVRRFFNQGMGDGKIAYSARGPFFSTTAAIADALGYELKLVKRNIK